MSLLNNFLRFLFPFKSTNEFKSDTNSSDKDEQIALQKRLDKDKVLYFLFKFIIYGIILVGLYCMVYVWPNISSFENWIHYFKGLGIMLLISGGAYMSGLLLGALFAIPRVGDNQIGEKSNIIQNDNLVQISDWITKIIVGVGLTQLYKIPHFLVKLGDYLSDSFGAPPTGSSAAIGALLYFSIVGFITSYFWTRTYFTQILKDTTDGLAEKLENELKENQEKLATTENEKEQLKQTLDIKTDEIDAINNSVDIEGIIGSFKSSMSHPEAQSDPNKNKFGGLSEANGRKVTADVSTTSFSGDLFNIVIRVVSTDSTRPLIDSVKFYLHPTFDNPERIVKVENGIAELKLLCWGAFTVGIECDKGKDEEYKTRLELDLAGLPNAPQKFKER